RGRRMKNPPIMIRATSVTMSIVAALVLLAESFCACTPKPPPPPPPQATVEAPPPAPPPEPKCEALSENCIAKAGRRSKGTDSWTIAPPEGWTFANQPTTVLATSEAAVLGVSSLESAAPTQKDKPAVIKERASKRDEMIAGLSDKLGLALKQKKLVLPAKPN